MELNVLSLIALPDDGAIVNIVSDTGKVGCPSIAAHNVFRPLEYLDRFQFIQRPPGAIEARIQHDERFDAAAEEKVRQVLS